MNLHSSYLYIINSPESTYFIFSKEKNIPLLFSLHCSKKKYKNVTSFAIILCLSLGYTCSFFSKEEDSGALYQENPELRPQILPSVFGGLGAEGFLSNWKKDVLWATRMVCQAEISDSCFLNPVELLSEKGGRRECVGQEVVCSTHRKLMSTFATGKFH